MSIDMASVRDKNRDAFVEAIDRFAEENTKTGGLFAKTEDTHALFTAPGIHVAVRKRPLWDKERERGEFDVMSVGGRLVDGLADGARDTMWLHNARLRLDARHMYVDHHGFPFDAVFDERHDTEEVYRRAVAPLVAVARLRGGRAAVVAFGQTGTGKTFTMTRIGELAAAELFAAAAITRIELTAVEVAGDTVRDLLATGGDAVVLREGADGDLALVGATPARVASADALCALLNTAYEKRATSATGVNDTSSRSHAIYRVATWEEGTEDAGVLTLVDLAGSEWSRDQAEHSRERQAEAREINSSLMTLKQCVRARISADRRTEGKAKKQHMPIRDAKLTRLLKDCFAEPKASTLVIACVSPACGDLEHTIESLRGGQGVEGASGWGMPPETLLSSNVNGLAVLSAEEEAARSEKAKEERAKSAKEGGDDGASEQDCTPRAWTASQVCEWWTTQAALAFRAAAAASEQPPSTFTIEVNASAVGVAGEGTEGDDDEEEAKKKTGQRCKLGLSFAKEEMAGGAPRVGAVSATGLVWAILRREHRTLPPGSLLIGVGAELFDATTARKTVLAALKPRAMELGAAAVAWNAREEGVPPPPELKLRLTFQSESVECPRMPPPIPSIFTGESRMGICEGAQLCAEFGTVSFVRSKFVRATAPHKFVGAAMWTCLRARMGDDAEREALRAVIDVM